MQYEHSNRNIYLMGNVSIDPESTFEKKKICINIQCNNLLRYCFVFTIVKVLIKVLFAIFIKRLFNSYKG